MAFARRQAAVVRGEHHDRLLFELQFSERLEHGADRPVGRLHHGGVHRVALDDPDLPVLAPPGPDLFGLPELVRLVEAALFSAPLVLLDQLVRRLLRVVDLIKREVSEERLVPVISDEAAGLFRKAIGEILALRAVGELWVVVRGEVPIKPPRRARRVAPLVHVEALSFRPVFLLRPEVPFAGEVRGIPRRLERLAERRQARGHEAVVRGVIESLGPMAAEPVGRVVAGRVLSGHETQPAR